MAKLIAINDEEFDIFVLQTKRAAVLFKCGDMKSDELELMLEQLADNFQTISFVSIDTSKYKEISKKFDLKMVPIILFFADGKKIDGAGVSSKREEIQSILTALSTRLDSVNNDNFDEEVLQNEKPTIVFFRTEWCSYCRAMAPIMKQVADEFKDQIKVLEIDARENMEKSDEFCINSIPQFLFFRDGELVYSILGARPMVEFTSKVNNVLDQTKQPSPLLDIYDDNFDQLVLRSAKLTIVLFTNDQTSYCEILIQIMEQIAFEFKDRIKVFQMGALSNPETTNGYSVQKFSNLIFFFGGVIFRRLDEIKTKEEIESIVEDCLQHIIP